VLPHSPVTEPAPPTGPTSKSRRDCVPADVVGSWPPARVTRLLAKLFDLSIDGW